MLGAAEWACQPCKAYRRQVERAAARSQRCARGRGRLGRAHASRSGRMRWAAWLLCTAPSTEQQLTQAARVPRLPLVCAPCPTRKAASTRPPPCSAPTTPPSLHSRAAARRCRAARATTGAAGAAARRAAPSPRARATRRRRSRWMRRRRSGGAWSARSACGGAARRCACWAARCHARLCRPRRRGLCLAGVAAGRRCALPHLSPTHTSKPPTSSPPREQQGAPPELEPWFCPVCKYPDRGRPLFQCAACADSFHFECAGMHAEVRGPGWGGVAGLGSGALGRRRAAAW